MIKNRLDNYLIPPKNGHLTHINPKLYIKCPPWCNVINQRLKRWKNQIEYVAYFILNVSQDAMSQTKSLKMKKPNWICNLAEKKLKANPKKDHWTKRQPCTYTKPHTRSLNIFQLIDIHI
jgi:hypothetical protein